MTWNLYSANSWHYSCSPLCILSFNSILALCVALGNILIRNEVFHTLIIPYNRWGKYRKRKVPCTFSVRFTELWSTQISVIVHPSAGDKLAIVHWSCLFGAESYSAQRERKSVWQGFHSQIWQTLQVFIYIHSCTHLMTFICA